MTSSERQPLLRDGNPEWPGYPDILMEVSYDDPSRRATRRFLSSKPGHYSILALVSLDVSCIFADFLISLYVCDHRCDKSESVYVSPEAFFANTGRVMSKKHHR